MSEAPLSGRTAVVTGGAEGIGAAIAERLKRDGAAVVIADVQQERGEAAARAMGAAFVRLDVTREEDWDALLAAHPRFHILVNNAGINNGPAPFEELSFARWRNTLGVNLDGAFLGCRAGVRAMAPMGGGVIVNIGSAAGERAVGEMAAYTASKAGVHALTRAVALYCGKRGYNIRCSAVLPGSIETPMVARLRAESGDAPAARARIAERHPIGFVGDGADIAAMVAFLVSDDARFITGALMNVDGGLTI
ncbi:MAG: SDR family oxidoreductase [Alphaproteobacteria bacterium]|nr:SDR family oxidoreductase [Alphaproteobacteria bacterium]